MKHSTRRIATLGAFTLSAALVLSACSGSGDTSGGSTEDSGSDELTSVKLQLQWLPQGQFAGYFAAVNESGAHLITEEPPATAWTNDWIQKALDELEGEDLDLTGESFEPIDVTLEEGGN